MILKQTNRTRIILAGILISVILLACLGSLGYFGIKTMHRSHLRAEAREAFASEDWKKAEKLLNEYIAQDPDSEEDVVRLAQVYRHFGDTGEEMYCWYRACVLNPLKPEYWDAYVESAMNARDFQRLFSDLSRRTHSKGELSPKEKILFLICMVMTARAGDAEQFYDSMLNSDPEAFRKDELGRYAEFLVTYGKHTESDNLSFIENGIKSDDPFVRLESILLYLVSLESSDMSAESIPEEEEKLLKEAADLNRFAGTPYLADFYFLRLKFSSVIELLEPYLEDIDHIPMSVLYAESCVYGAQAEKLKPFAEHYRHNRKYRQLVFYFDALYDFSQGLEKSDELARYMHEVNDIVHSPLANLINLQIALNTDSMEKIYDSFDAIIKQPPFYDVQARARSAVHLYLWNKVQDDSALADDPRLVKLAQLLTTFDSTDPFLMRILISDLHRRNLLNRQTIQEKLEAFPFDPYLLQVAAEYELFNNNPEQCLEYTERFYTLKDVKSSTAFDLLHMLALELTGKIDEATKEYTDLVNNTQMNLGILYRYFEFCIKHERRKELSTMADRLDASTVPEHKALAPFFRAEELLLQEKKDEALSLLATAKTDHPDFAFRAATLFSKNDMLDQALSRYLALVDSYPEKQLVFANIAEVYLAKEMKAEALSYAKRCWEMNPDNELGQFIYAQVLNANGQYQEAEKVLKIPNHPVDLPDEVKKLWSDIMRHCVQEDLENGLFSRAFERANHYLFFFPDDDTFLKFRTRAELRVREMPGPEKTER